MCRHQYARYGSGMRSDCLLNQIRHLGAECRVPRHSLLFSMAYLRTRQLPIMLTSLDEASFASLPRVVGDGSGPPSLRREAGRSRLPTRLCRVMLKAERGDIYDAMSVLGLKKRTVEALAARGELPGAAKLANRWTFDLKLLRSHVRDEVERQWAENTQKHQQAASGVAILSTVGLGSKAGSSHGRFAQVTRSLRQRGARQAKTA
jgi:hypothetical protein